MGKVDHERKTRRFMWNGVHYPYETSEVQAQQQQRVPAHRNGTPRASARGSADNLLAALSGQMHDGSVRLSRVLSSSSNNNRILSLPDGTAIGLHAAADSAADIPLKRLTFVRSQGTFWLAWMSSAYSRGRSYVPLPHKVVSVVESTMASVSGGLYSLAGQRSEKVLYALDAKVDLVLRSTTDVDRWWSDLAQHPPVKFALTTYQNVHDTVVATPAYTRALELGEGTLTRVHESSLYKSIQPLLAPLAEPAVKRIRDSPAFQAVKEHLMPTAQRAASAQ